MPATLNRRITSQATGPRSGPAPSDLPPAPPPRSRREPVTEFRQELPPSDGARPAADLIARALHTWHVDDPGATVRLVVSELIENVHLHTGGSGELRIALTGSGILIAVSDPSPASPAVKNPGTGLAGGRGLKIVQALAQNWGTWPHSGGKTVWAHIALTATTLTAPDPSGPGGIRRSVRDRATTAPAQQIGHASNQR